MEVSTSLSWQWQAKKRPRGPLDPFFEEGDAICCYAAKQLSLEPDVEETPTSLPSFPCCISGCSETLDSILSYEVHYNSVHRHVCSECHRTFPSNHLLEIHLQESHDPLFDLVPGNKYVCLTLGCGVKFSSPKSRRNHMVKHHKFPANFRFNRTKPQVPQSICFGQGSVRGFHRPRARRKPKHWHQSNVEMDTTVQIENVNLEVLKDALGDG